MLIDGEKYACEACVRGHRVSNCQHADRPLQHINKKGRPVSQCQHCRTMRKSRSAHIKCDCGEKTSKCIHLRTPQEGHRDTCCCNHGGRCTCAHKKEQNQLDPVPESESDKDATSPSRSTKSLATRNNRRRANTIHSDSGFTFDENGYHKPTHKGNKASQKCNPYQLQRGNSVHGTSTSGMTRSADNLLRKNGCGKKGNRTSKSETASPQMSSSCSFPSTAAASSSTFAQLNTGLSPLDLSSIEYPPYMPNFDLFSNGLPEEQPIISAGLPSASSIDWNRYDGLPTKFSSSSYGQGSSTSSAGFGGSAFDFGSDQGLTNTTSNSGDVSEVEDLMSQTGHCDDSFGLSTSSSFIGLDRTHLLASPDFSSMTFDDVLTQNTNSKYLPGSALEETYPASGFSMTEDALWASNFGAMPESPIESGTTLWDRQ